VSDRELLRFREVCEVLPVDAQKYLVRVNKLGDALMPYLQREGREVPRNYAAPFDRAHFRSARISSVVSPAFEG
jgi:hypothetical protein